jgi:hypothetical protein
MVDSIKKVQSFAIAVATTVALMCPLTASAAGKSAGGTPPSKTVINSSYGAKTKPSEVRQETHASGRKDTYYGNSRSTDGKIGKPHGHTVQSSDGKIQYARTPEGRVLKDTKASVPTQSPKPGKK